MCCKRWKCRADEDKQKQKNPGIEEKVDRIDITNVGKQAILRENALKSRPQRKFFHSCWLLGRKDSGSWGSFFSILSPTKSP